jgi:hypothetical protein
MKKPSGVCHTTGYNYVKILATLG